MDTRSRRSGALARRLISAPAALGVSCLLLFLSCTPVIGWGVVLWSPDQVGVEVQAEPQGSASPAAPVQAPATGLRVGQVVPIYVKSGIQKVFIVGVPGGKTKAEISQWRLESFSSKRKAKAYLEELRPAIDLWGIATRDGLSVRSKPDSAASRVYRLREKETVKVLRKVDGAAVTTGEERLEGDWYQVLSSDGTRGFVFSYTLTLFDSTKQSATQVAASLRRERDDSIDLVLAKTWRPEIFRTMIEQKRYDLEEFSMRYGLFTDLVNKQVRLELPTVSEVFEYEETVRLRANLYGFEGTHLQIQVRGEDLLTVSFPDEAGKTKAVVMVLVEEDMEALARAEESRRQSILDGMLARGSLLASDAYGSISITRSRRFTWKGYELLTPAAIPPGMGETGEMVFDRYVDESLAAAFDGVVNFKFDALPEGDSARFFYKLSPEGMRLEQMPPDAFEPTGLTAVKRGTGPVTAFFAYRD